MKEKIVKTYESFKEEEDKWWERHSPLEQKLGPGEGVHKVQDVKIDDDDDFHYDDEFEDGINNAKFVKLELEKEGNEMTQEYVDDMLDNGFDGDDILSFVKNYLSKINDFK